MLPTIAIVGRPNVGKSTLFNVLTQTRDALVADQAGLTRDRKIGRGYFNDQAYLLVDTGGLNGETSAMGAAITQQALLAVEESDCILLLVDGQIGLTPTDEQITQQLRQFNIPIHLVINKTENQSPEQASAEFYRLGLTQLYTISAAHNQGIEGLMASVFAQQFNTTQHADEVDDLGIKVAIIGRPNVGKSTLVNRMLGYERVITFDQPGTTRDSIFIPFQHQGQWYTLIDTAGIRRRSKVYETIEKFSVIKALQAIEAAHVVIMLLDAQEGITDQDSHLLGDILQRGRALVIAVNKWDGLSSIHRQQIRYHLNRKLHFIDFAKIHFISALHGSGVGNLFESIKAAWQAAHCQVNTARLNRLLQDAVTAHPPPMIQGRRIKLRYIHQGGYNPPLFVVHGNQVEAIPQDYKRYLVNNFRSALALEGTPIDFEFKQGDNPFQGRKNTLTPRQQKKRERLIQHVKKKK